MLVLELQMVYILVLFTIELAMRQFLEERYYSICWVEVTADCTGIYLSLYGDRCAMVNFGGNLLKV